MLATAGRLDEFYGEEHATKVIPTFVARVREWGRGSVFKTAESFSHQFTVRLYSMFNLIFELRYSNENGNGLTRELRVAKYTEGGHPERWIPFRIEDNGIQIEKYS
jgi:KaiC/GvpD/RAD55 family RecA-like ATPase